MNERIIVTGGAGFIGSNIVRALNKRGDTNILIVDNIENTDKEKNLESLKYSDYLDKGDFRKDFLSNHTEKATTIFHMGACSSTTVTDEEYVLDNNYQYSRDLCAWAMNNSARFIYASSAATYGDGVLGYSDKDKLTPQLKPLNLYGRSKQMFDMWAMSNGLLDKIVGLKFFNVYGPGEDHKGEMRSLVNKAYSQVLETGKLKLFKSHKKEYADGEQERDFVYVDDAVGVSLFFDNNRDISGLFNCGTGKARTWIDLAKAVFSALGKEDNIEFIDMPNNIRDKYQYHTQADLAKLQSAGYDKDFTSIEEGVADYIKNYLGERA